MDRQFLCILLLLLALTASCINPFAPAKMHSDSEPSLLGDQKTIEGFFQNFQYAYNFKDTLVYSNLLADNFTFSYVNYDKNIDLTWSRAEDMLTTYRLFISSQNLDLVWNEIVSEEGDNSLKIISRSFNLTITFNPSDIVRIYGKANFRLQRADTLHNWKLVLWRDESTY